MRMRERERERLREEGRRRRWPCRGSKGAKQKKGSSFVFSSFLNPEPDLSLSKKKKLKKNSTTRAPTFKWGITFANIADFSRPAETISTPQQCAVTATGVIWSRFATQITPVNYNLLTVNAFMAMTGMYQLSRKFGLIESGGVVVKEEAKKEVSPA